MALSLSQPRRALITGAGSGIGQGLALILALEHGWSIIATDLNLVRCTYCLYGEVDLYAS
jgi:NAD(P)-dependent dehydrogenase (short-subunit alcohol dehydrogenase family)